MAAPAACRIAPLGAILCLHGANASMPKVTLAAAVDDAGLCHAAIAATEKTTRIPDAFLGAMGRVESGRRGAGGISPWPWTVNAAGIGHFYPTKEAAVAAVRQFRAEGVRSVDVGCLQVNLFYHPDAFASLEEAFDPAANAAFAAKLLLELFDMTGSWPRAAAAYHSMTPAVGLAYQQKVLAEWAIPDKAPAEAPRRSAGLRLRTHEKPDVVPPAQQAVAVVPPIAAVPAAAAAPLGFNRRFLLPPQSQGVGRSLAAYRAMPVRLALSR